MASRRTGNCRIWVHQTLAEAGEAVAELIEHEAATAPAED